MNKKERKLATLQIPAERIVCCFCRKKLGGMNRLNICTSAGVVILACNQHAEAGDRLVRLEQVTAFALAGGDTPA